MYCFFTSIYLASAGYQALCERDAVAYLYRSYLFHILPIVILLGLPSCAYRAPGLDWYVVLKINLVLLTYFAQNHGKCSVMRLMLCMSMVIFDPKQ